jgi:hypothetical protein
VHRPHLRERHVRRVLQHDLPQRLAELERVAVRVQHPGHGLVGLLKVRHEHGVVGSLVVLEVLRDVRHHPDHRPPAELALVAHGLEALAERFLARPQGLRQRLVHDHHRLAAGRIGIGEVTSRVQRDPERAEEARGGLG